MEISLGSAGPKDAGVTTIGGRPVDQAAPEPKRPEPVKPVAAKSDAMPIPTKSIPPPKPSPPPKKIVEQAKAPSTLTAPPTTGRQVTPGNSRAETGITGMGAGLARGGGGVGAQAMLSDFCCPAYLEDVIKRIRSQWEEKQPERGSVLMQFTIQRGGQVTDLKVVQASTFILERASRYPFINLRMQMAPLPAEFTEPSLTLRLTFEYK